MAWWWSWVLTLPQLFGLAARNWWQCRPRTAI